MLKHKAKFDLMRIKDREADTAMKTIPEIDSAADPTAFFKNTHLEEVILPEGLEEIGRSAFFDCGIKRVVVPASVKRIKEYAFLRLKSLKEIVIKGEDTIIEVGAFYECPFDIKFVMEREPRFDERLHWFGISFLVPDSSVCPVGTHISDPRFRMLAESCALGNSSAMWGMAEYFSGLGACEFYRLASNFWRYNAAQKNNAFAIKWLEDQLNENPNMRMPSVLPELFAGLGRIGAAGNVNGKVMSHMGFSLFDAERDYYIAKADKNGIIIIDSWCGDEGPDEDGFGREEYYDWWFADEYLKQIPGTQMVHSHSTGDIKSSPIYSVEYNKAKEWMSYVT